MNGSPRLPAARWLVAALFSLLAQAASASTPRVVLELFTSQGCSSCPPADALVGRLTADPSVLALSLHVNYWDDLGWKDTFSSDAATERQYAYARSLGERTVFTPQLVVNGAQSVVGSQGGAVQHAVETSSRNAPFPVRLDLARQPDGHFTLNLTGPKVSADVWELRYVRRAVTQIHNGENGGRTLETYNNVTELRRLGAFTPGILNLPPLKSPEDGVAVLVQAPRAGKVLGAAAY
jgi:hypothetical protein